MKYLKKFEELTWSDLKKGKFDYYVQGGEGAKELEKVKLDILESMDIF